MKDIVEPISEALVKDADTEDIIFTRSDPIDNSLQLIYEMRITLEDLETVITNLGKPGDKKKIVLYYANELVKYLSAKLAKGRQGSFRGGPQRAPEKQKKLSKSEQFLERKRKEARDKAAKDEKNKEGQVEKIGLKEIGQEIQEHEKTMAEMDKKREEQQKSTEEEHSKHTGAYQTAFELFALVVKISSEGGQDNGELCELIKQMGDTSITKRQIAIDKLANNPQCYFAVNAMIAALKDKNILHQVIRTMRTIGEKRTIVPLINLIKEHSGGKDILFRGPAEQSIGETVRLMNEKEKSSGTKYLYQLCLNPKFEQTLRSLNRILTRDLSDKKIRSEYFTPQCIKWISLIAEKAAEQKKKQIKVGFVKMSVHTDVSKELLELVNSAK
ncbi:hypothetical protein IID62_00675 [candidate division KSB1 bacterium]|nr:hypothetical protein [candidate division KSB1 bacterium]